MIRVGNFSFSRFSRTDVMGGLPDLNEMLEDLEALVAVESPSRDLEALRHSADALAALMSRRLGSAPTIIDSAVGPHVHWRAGGNAAALLVGHHDTVFPIGSLANRPFRVQDGKAFGPGVFDMKAGLVQAIHAIASLEDPSGVEMLVSADEEIGSGASRDMIVDRARVCGNVLVLEPSADGGALKTARKGTGTYEVLVHGLAAHAGLEPEKGVNALVEASRQVLVISTLGDPERGTTVTPTVATVGTADNVVPALARVLVDVRAEDPQETARVDAAMRSLSVGLQGASIEIRGGFNRPPMPASMSRHLFLVACDAARELGLGELAGVGVGGGSDGNFTAAAGVSTLDGLGAVGGGAHADHEWVDVTAMVDRSRLIAGILERLRQV